MDIYCMNLADAWGFVETRKELVLGFCPVCLFRNAPMAPEAPFPDDISGSLTPAGGLVPFDLHSLRKAPNRQTSTASLGWECGLSESSPG
jgi:hypothetical protein